MATPRTGQRQAEDRYWEHRVAPPRAVRLSGRLGSRLIVSAPWLWPLLRRPARRIWERMAQRWDEDVKPDWADHVAPLAAACERLDRAPSRILEVGTGTGAGAVMLARRFPDAEVMGVDLSEAMVSAARAKRQDDLMGRLDFAVGDAASLGFAPSAFDLIAHLNIPPFLDEVVRLVRPGGYVVVADSFGPGTPSYIPERVLRKRLERRGLRAVASGRAEAGTFFIAQRPGKDA
jgi:SAM-dependent methyltransferase